MGEFNNLLSTLVNSILSGGSAAITAILICIISYLLFERKKLVSDKDELIKKNEAMLISIIEKYYGSRLDTTKSNDAIMAVLAQIERKL